MLKLGRLSDSSKLAPTVNTGSINPYGGEITVISSAFAGYPTRKTPCFNRREVYWIQVGLGWSQEMAILHRIEQ